jgi:hypothetical protein
MKTDLRERGMKDVYWIHLIQNRNTWQALVNIVLNLWVPKQGEEILTSLTQVILI